MLISPLSSRVVWFRPEENVVDFSPQLWDYSTMAERTRLGFMNDSSGVAFALPQGRVRTWQDNVF
jgi:hypothetical protein